MKKILFFPLMILLASPGISLAQGGIRMTSNVKMVCDGDVSLVINDGRFNNVSGTFTPGESTVKFVGTASTSNSVIQGKAFTFYNLMVHKNQNDVQLLVKSSINNQLIFSRGDLDLNNTQISLNSSSGFDASFLDEDEGSHTYGTATQSKVTKAKTLSYPYKLFFGELGIRISADGNFGKTTLDRRHEPQTLPTGNSILKYWRISTTNSPSNQFGNLQLHYFTSELNGLNEADLSVWYSNNSGQTWTNLGATVRSPNENFVEIDGLTDIEGWWTLGAVTPLNGPLDDRASESDNIRSALDWTMAPNPATDVTTAQFQSETTGTATIALYSADGKLVLQTDYPMQKGANNCRLNLGNLVPGVYFARVKGQNFRPIALVKG